MLHKRSGLFIALCLSLLLVAGCLKLTSPPRPLQVLATIANVSDTEPLKVSVGIESEKEDYVTVDRIVLGLVDVTGHLAWREETPVHQSHTVSPHTRVHIRTLPLTGMTQELAEELSITSLRVELHGPDMISVTVPVDSGWFPPDPDAHPIDPSDPGTEPPEQPIEPGEPENPDPEPPPQPDPDPVPDPKEDEEPWNPGAELSPEEYMVWLINQERALLDGREPLEMDPYLNELALLKSLDMQKLGYFDHVSPTYGTPMEMLADYGINYRWAGENIARVPRTYTLADINREFMDSVDHRENIICRCYTKVGIGIYNDGYRQYVTQLFYKPR